MLVCRVWNRVPPPRTSLENQNVTWLVNYKSWDLWSWRSLVSKAKCYCELAEHKSHREKLQLLRENLQRLFERVELRQCGWNVWWKTCLRRLQVHACYGDRWSLTTACQLKRIFRWQGSKHVLHDFYWWHRHFVLGVKIFINRVSKADRLITYQYQAYTAKRNFKKNLSNDLKVYKAEISFLG